MPDAECRRHTMWERGRQMHQELIRELSVITQEEQRILDGKAEIDQQIYTEKEDMVIDSSKLLQRGKLIQVRPHTRFVHFPEHTHNYIEVIYMCKGSTTHILNGNKIVLSEGDILFLNQNAVQEILPAGKDDIAVNFIVLPEFLDIAFSMMGTEENQLRDFLVGAICGRDGETSWLYFHVSDILPVQNLVENMVWTIFYDSANKRSCTQITMGLLFLQLLNCMDKVEAGGRKFETEITAAVLSYIDESNLYRRMHLYTKQFDWEKMWAIADDITDEDAIRAKAQDILDTFDIEGGGSIEEVWEMAKYVVAFEKWVKDEKLGLIASHYDGFAQGKAGVLDSMLIPAFSMLIKQGTACAVEGDMKVAMAMSILKTISGTGQLAEMYSIDFNDDIAIIGHSGSGDADNSDKKPTMKIVKVFHGKTGGGYLTQFYPYTGPVTYLAITQDGDGHFKFIAAEGVNEEGKILSFGDTNMRTRFTCGAREFVTRWSECGPTHHFAAATGRHIDTILKVAKIFNVPVDIVTR